MAKSKRTLFVSFRLQPYLGNNTAEVIQLSLNILDL
jgi:hypothetical protein